MPDPLILSTLQKLHWCRQVMIFQQLTAEVIQRR
jgi:hypothetical protein